MEIAKKDSLYLTDSEFSLYFKEKFSEKLKEVKSFVGKVTLTCRIGKVVLYGMPEDLTSAHTTLEKFIYEKINKRYRDAFITEINNPKGQALILHLVKEKQATSKQQKRFEVVVCNKTTISWEKYSFLVQIDPIDGTEKLKFLKLTSDKFCNFASNVRILQRDLDVRLVLETGSIINHSGPKQLDFINHCFIKDGEFIWDKGNDDFIVTQIRIKNRTIVKTKIFKFEISNVETKHTFPNEDKKIGCELEIMMNKSNAQFKMNKNEAGTWDIPECLEHFDNWIIEIRDTLMFFTNT